MERRVAVVGATGYVGQAVVAALLTSGRQVTMIARQPVAAVPQGANFVACDARDAASLAHSLRDAHQIVNAVAGSPFATAQVATNLAAWACATAEGGGIRIVHVSSLAVFGQCVGVLTESTPPLKVRRHPYAAAKRYAEKILQSDPMVAASCAILRPGCIYGTEAPVWSSRIGRLLLSGRLGWLGREGGGWCHAVHVTDVAAAIISALSAGAESAGIHHVVAPSTLTWNEYFRSFAVHLGLQSVAHITGPQLAAETWLAAPLAHAAARMCGSPADMITPSMRRLFRNRSLAASARPTLHPIDAFRSLDLGLADAAQSILHPNASTPAPRFGRPSSLATAA